MDACDEGIEKEMLDIAIERSFQSEECSQEKEWVVPCHVFVKHVKGTHYVSSPQNMSPLQRELSVLQKKMGSIPPAIEVRRDFVLKDALKEAGKKKFDINKKIKVTIFEFIVET